jgi:hypothetical protein
MNRDPERMRLDRQPDMARVAAVEEAILELMMQELNLVEVKLMLAHLNDKIQEACDAIGLDVELTKLENVDGYIAKVEISPECYKRAEEFRDAITKASKEEVPLSEMDKRIAQAMATLEDMSRKGGFDYGSKNYLN